MNYNIHHTSYLKKGLILLLLFSCSIPGNSQDLTSTDKKVILILKFAEYIQWENESNIDTFKFGIFSDDEKLIRKLNIYETIKIKDKVISLHRFYNIKNISDVHVLVLSNDKNYLIDEIAKAIQGQQILMISDRCKKQEFVMINFIYGNNQKLDFEVNKANIIKENMSIMPDLLLLGGTEVDITALYKESQNSLFEIQKKVRDLEQKYNEQQKELNIRNKLLEDKNKEIEAKTSDIDKQNLAIENQKNELILLTDKVKEQDSRLAEDFAKLEKLQRELNSRTNEIEKSNRVLEQLNIEINQKQSRIIAQETSITGYKSTVNQQETIIYLAITSLAMLLITVIFIYRGFINKKKTAQKLAEKEAEIRMLFDIAPLPVVMTELQSGKAIYINQLGQDMFKLNTKNALKYISSKDYYVNESQRNDLINNLSQTKRVNNIEILFKDKTGKQFYGSVSGLITNYEHKKVMFLAIKDITDIKNAVNELNNYKDHLEDLVKERSQKLLESQRRFKDMAELLPETIFEMNKDGNISFINKRGMEMFGIKTPLNNTKLNLYSLLDESELKAMTDLINRLISGKQLQTTEFQFKRDGAKNFPAIIYMNPHFKDSHSPIIRGIIVDITERKDLERRILNTMIETEEKERKRFAEDLHDGLGSLLSSLNLYVDMLDDPNISNDERKKLFTTLRSIIDESIRNSKEISNNLRPSTLSRFGLVGSLQSFCDKINNTKKININLDHTRLTAKLNPNIENALYRISNELINNTLKYAKASNVWIKLESQNGTLHMSYKDDGVGFDKTKALSSEGMGLKNIYTRVSSINGLCSIKSIAGEGINVFITVKTDNV